MKKISPFIYIFLVYSMFTINCTPAAIVEKNEPWTGPPKLLIMYYVDADNSLEKDLMLDLNEIEAIDIAYNGIKIVALVDRGKNWTGDGDWEDARAFEVGYDEKGYNETLSSNTKRIAIPSLGISTTSQVELNMGDPETLTKFIQFCKQNYTADNYMLLIANHGNGWRDNTSQSVNPTRSIAEDDTLPSGFGSDELTTKEVGQAIYNGLDIANGGAKLDIIAMDACLMGMIEVAYELRNVSKYFIASSENVPVYGYPYTQIMKELKGIKGTMTPEDISKAIVDNYYNAYTNGLNVEGPNQVAYDITMSVTDLSQMDTVVSAINQLSASLYYNSYSSLTTMRSSDQFADSHSVDLYDMCEKIKVNDSENRYLDETTTLMNALKDSANKAIFYHKAGKEHSESNGLAIYLPDKGYYNSDYNSSNLEFAAAAPYWVVLVKALSQY